MIERAIASPMDTYQDGLRQGQLLFQYSSAAEKAFFPPRLFCPFSATEQFEWRQSSGRGTIYSASSVTVRNGPSYAVALVDVDEGFRMLSRIVNASGEKVAIGARVRLSVGAGEDGEQTAFFELVQNQ